MDNYYNNYNNTSFFSGATKLDDQTTDSYQSPDIYLNLEEDRPPKIEEEDNEFPPRNDWITPSDNIGNP